MKNEKSKRFIGVFSKHDDFEKNSKAIRKCAKFLSVGLVIYVFAVDFSYNRTMEPIVLIFIILEIAVIAYIIFYSLVALNRIYKEVENIRPYAENIQSMRDLIKISFQSRNFRSLIFLVLGMLAVAAALIKLIGLLPGTVLGGVYEFLIYLMASVVSFALVLIGVFFASKKSKKTVSSIFKLIIANDSFVGILCNRYFYYLCYFLSINVHMAWWRCTVLTS